MYCIIGGSYESGTYHNITQQYCFLNTIIWSAHYFFIIIQYPVYKYYCCLTMVTEKHINKLYYLLTTYMYNYNHVYIVTRLYRLVGCACEIHKFIVKISTLIML